MQAILLLLFKIFSIDRIKHLHDILGFRWELLRRWNPVPAFSTIKWKLFKLSSTEFWWNLFFKLYSSSLLYWYIFIRNYLIWKRFNFVYSFDVQHCVIYTLINFKFIRSVKNTMWIVNMYKDKLWKSEKKVSNFPNNL